MVTLRKRLQNAETYGGNQYGEDDDATSIKTEIEDPEMSSTLKDAAAVVGDGTITIENPETLAVVISF